MINDQITAALIAWGRADVDNKINRENMSRALLAANAQAPVAPQPITDAILTRMLKDENRGDEVYRCGYNQAIENVRKILAMRSYLAAPTPTADSGATNDRVSQIATIVKDAIESLMLWNGQASAGLDVNGLAGLRDEVALLAAAQPAVAPVAVEAKFLVVAMTDDDTALLHYCRDEAQIEEAVATLMFSGELEDDDRASVKAHTADLIEEGFINFEGDPGIHLYRLAPAAPQEPK